MCTGNGSAARDQGTCCVRQLADEPLKSPCIVTDRIAHIHRTRRAHYAPHPRPQSHRIRDTAHTQLAGDIASSPLSPPHRPRPSSSLASSAKPQLASTDAPASFSIHLGPAVRPDVSQPCRANTDQGIPRFTSRPLRHRNLPARRPMGPQSPAQVSRCSSWRSRSRTSADTRSTSSPS